MGHIERVRIWAVAWMTGARRRSESSAPTTIQLEDVESGVTPMADDRWRRPRWSGVIPLAVMTAATVILLAIQVTGSPADSGADGVWPSSPSPSPSSPSTPSVERSPGVGAPRFIAPDTATPGERITVLAFRNRCLCGLSELRFDGRPVTHRLDSYVGGPSKASWMEMFLIVEVPPSARPGRHEIQLYGPVLGGRRDAMCADVHEHQGMLATAVIIVKPGLTSDRASRQD